VHVSRLKKIGECFLNFKNPSIDTLRARRPSTTTSNFKLIFNFNLRKPRIATHLGPAAIWVRSRNVCRNNYTLGCVVITKRRLYSVTLSLTFAAASPRTCARHTEHEACVHTVVSEQNPCCSSGDNLHISCPPERTPCGQNLQPQLH
jgi:hypothetical protein